MKLADLLLRSLLSSCLCFLPVSAFFLFPGNIFGHFLCLIESFSNNMQ